MQPRRRTGGAALLDPIQLGVEAPQRFQMVRELPLELLREQLVVGVQVEARPGEDHLVGEGQGTDRFLGDERHTDVGEDVVERLVGPAPEEERDAPEDAAGARGSRPLGLVLHDQHAKPAPRHERRREARQVAAQTTAS
jgi:hypothetical protein